MSCPRHDLQTIKTSRHVKVSAKDKISEKSPKALISNDKLKGFRAVIVPFEPSGQDIYISRSAYKQLNLSSNHIVRICVL